MKATMLLHNLEHCIWLHLWDPVTDGTAPTPRRPPHRDAGRATGARA